MTMPQIAVDTASDRDADLAELMNLARQQNPGDEVDRMLDPLGYFTTRAVLPLSDSSETPIWRVHWAPVYSRTKDGAAAIQTLEISWQGQERLVKPGRMSATVSQLRADRIWQWSASGINRDSMCYGYADNAADALLYAVAGIRALYEQDLRQNAERSATQMELDEASDKIYALIRQGLTPSLPEDAGTE